MVVDEADQAADQAGGRRGGKRLGDDGAAGARMHAGIGDELAIRPVDQRLGVRGGLGELVEQRLGKVRVERALAARIVLHRRLRQRAGIDAGLFAQGGDLGGEQALLVLVQVEQGSENQRDREQVHEQDVAQ